MVAIVRFKDESEVYIDVEGNDRDRGQRKMRYVYILYIYQVHACICVCIYTRVSYPYRCTYVERERERERGTRCETRSGRIREAALTPPSQGFIAVDSEHVIKRHLLFIQVSGALTAHIHCTLDTSSRYLNIHFITHISMYNMCIFDR